LYDSTVKRRGTELITNLPVGKQAVGTEAVCKNGFVCWFPLVYIKIGYQALKPLSVN